MIRNIITSIGVGGLVASCMQSERIEISESNDLGVVSIQTTRFEAGGNQVFLLTAFDGGDQPRASVRLTHGTIPDLSRWAPGADNIGSEISLSVAGQDTRIVTRELGAIWISPLQVSEPETERFLALTAVSAVLDREANLHILQQAQTDGGELPLSTFNCPANYLNTTPVARQCCWGNTGAPSGGPMATLFLRADNAIIGRLHGSGACKSSTGGTCLGAQCYYGPNSFAKPTVTTPTLPYVRIKSSFNSRSGEYYCASEQSSSPLTPIFPDATGTFPTGQGCPGGASGDGLWDY